MMTPAQLKEAQLDAEWLAKSENETTRLIAHLLLVMLDKRQKEYAAERWA
jgi:hypothetical protein